MRIPLDIKVPLEQRLWAESIYTIAGVIQSPDYINYTYGLPHLSTHEQRIRHMIRTYIDGCDTTKSW